MSDDKLSMQLSALAHSEDAPAGFAADIMSSIEQPTRRSIWQRMLDSFSPTVPRRRRIAALALLPATAAALSFVMVLWLAKPSVASDSDQAPPTTSDLLAANFTIYAPGARTVFLSGDFNGWAPNQLRLRDDDNNGTWSVVLHLAPGQYGYVFMVDGKRVLLPNGQRVQDDKRGAHSVMDVSANRLRMSLPGSKDKYRAALTKLTTSLRNVPSAQVFDVKACKRIAGVGVKNSTTGPDELHMVHADGRSVSALREAISGNQLVVSNASGFAAGDRVLVSNGSRSHLLDVASVRQRGSAWVLEVAAPPAGCNAGISYRPGTMVLKADVGRVYAHNGSLMFDADNGGPGAAVALAADVQDFQLALGVDRNRDGVLAETRRTDDEWFFNAAGDASPEVGQPAQAVRLTILARAATNGMRLPMIEDHKLDSAAAATAVRVISLTVALRNLETKR